MNKHIQIYTDGACRGNPGPGSCAYIFIKKDENTPFIQKARYLGSVTNNLAEYEAVIMALNRAKELSYKSIELYSDSQLVINQLNKIWKVRKNHLVTKFIEIEDLIREFDTVKFIHVRRSNKYIAMSDRLCNEVLDKNLN